MPIRLPRRWDITVEQLVELEHSLRVSASRASKSRAAKQLLALAEHYRALADQRQAEEGHEPPFR
jgi:hypothetical protein